MQVLSKSLALRSMSLFVVVLIIKFIFNVIHLNSSHYMVNDLTLTIPTQFLLGDIGPDIYQ